MVAVALPETCADTTRPMLWIWPGRAAYLGPSLRLAPHSTSVHCLVVGVDGPFDLSVDGAAATSQGSALIPPRTVHQVTASDGDRLLFCYLDANRRGANRHLASMTGRSGPVGIGHHAAARLRELGAAPAPDGAEIMAAATGTGGDRLDPRIHRVAARLLADPSGAPGATELAHGERLSVSYFLRLFGAETGTSFRRYRLWARMLAVARAVAAGADLTAAAADAGFASPSHFSDTFTRMFGLTATDFLASGASVVIADGPAAASSDQPREVVEPRAV